MKKINLEVTCKRHRFGYWNSCKRLPNFVNVAALHTRPVAQSVESLTTDPGVTSLIPGLVPYFHGV